MAKEKPINVMARGVVLPAGSVPPVAELKSGKHDLKILAVHKGVIPTDDEGNEIPQPEDVMRERDENPRSYVEVEYPDGFAREHHVLGMEDLLDKIINNLRARYGVETVDILQAKRVAPGEIIKVEV